MRVLNCDLAIDWLNCLFVKNFNHHHICRFVNTIEGIQLHVLLMLMRSSRDYLKRNRKLSSAERCLSLFISLYTAYLTKCLIVVLCVVVPWRLLQPIHYTSLFFWSLRTLYIYSNLTPQSFEGYIELFEEVFCWALCELCLEFFKPGFRLSLSF